MKGASTTPRFIFRCIQEDTVIHELFHVIGLWHEHMRADRDAFINVLYKNIEPGIEAILIVLKISLKFQHNILNLRSCHLVMQLLTVFHMIIIL